MGELLFNFVTEFNKIGIPMVINLYVYRAYIFIMNVDYTFTKSATFSNYVLRLKFIE